MSNQPNPAQQASDAYPFPDHLKGWNYWRVPETGVVTIMLPQKDLEAYVTLAIEAARELTAAQVVLPDIHDSYRAPASQFIEPQDVVVKESFVQRVRNDLLSWLDTYGEGHIDTENLVMECDALLRQAALPVAVGAGECERSREPVAERIGDMGEGTKLQLFREDDGDFIVSVMPARHRIPDLQVQFCTPGSGGGSSRHTWDALCALHAAMHADAAMTPATPAGKGQS